jgi:hypothetical protein
MVERIPETTHLLYSELLDALLRGAYSKRGISFQKRTVSGNEYWYLEYTIGSDRTAYYLGPNNEDLRTRIERTEANWAQDAPDAARRARLASMVVSGGGFAPTGSHARVLEALEQAGVFAAGGVLIGSHAFAAMSNMLGVRWPRTALRTQDIDLAHDPTITVTVPNTPINLQQILEKTDDAFFPVPSLNRKHPSTTFAIRGKDLSVSLLTPLTGKPSSEPVEIRALGAVAAPMRFLDFLLEDIQPVAIPIRQGILVNVPSPARFALHKLVVSRRRPAAFAEKARKDLAQAAAMLEVLVEDRPADISFAAEAAQKMPAKFRRQMEEGLAQLDDSLASAVRGCM